MRRLWFRLRAAFGRLLGPGAGDAELSDEVRSFVEHDTDARIRSGMTAEDARRATLVELGGVEQVKERVREDRSGAFWESLARDVRYAMRSLGQARGFSFSVIGSLSLGFGATILAFAIVNGAFLRPFPGVRDQHRLVEIGILTNTPFGWRLRPTASADYPDVVRAFDEGMPSLEGLASFIEASVAATLPQPRSLQAAFVSPNYFDVLGVQPEIGRTFAREEGRLESASVAVVSRALWIREFGGDPSVIGQSFRAGGQTFAVIGVAPPGFAGTTQNPIETGVDLWLPIVFTDRVAVDDAIGREGFRTAGPGERPIRYVGRMRDGVRADRVETELAVVAAGIVASIGSSEAGPAEPARVQVSGLARLDWSDAAPVAALILAAPLLVLLIACVNAANLFLVRASRRGREVAVRLALGASRTRLVRQLAIESLILAVVAGGVALGLVWSGLGWVAAYMTFPFPWMGTSWRAHS